MAAGRARVGDPVVRQRAVSLLAVALLLVFAARLVMIQGVQAAELSEQALQQRLVTKEVTSPRADIVDRDGVVLATTVDRYNIGVNQKDLAKWKRTDHGTVTAEGPMDAATILAPILGLDEEELAAKLVGDSTWVYIAKDVTPEVWNLVDEEDILGVQPESVSERIYPNGAIAGNIIGFMGGSADGPGTTGLAGLELAYNDLLTGTPGSITYESGGSGTLIPTGVHEETAPVAGKTLVTTFDRDVQWYTEDRVAQELRTTGASRATVVVQDATTGEILALVDSHSVDPNDPGATTNPLDRGSRAVSTVFEPGSTAKVITMAAAIEEGLVTPTTRIKAPYKFTTENKQTFKDSHDHGTQKLTVAGVLAESSNTGTVQIGSRLTTKQRYEYLKAFGFGSKTGLGMPGESAGILKDYKKWDGRSKYAVLFGQALGVTAVQTSQVFQTIANGGVQVQPTIVKGYLDEDGTFTARETEEPKRVVSEETAAKVMKMLESVTTDGTGKLAAIKGYRVAGKTGTAQATCADGSFKCIVASFVGVAPADDPRIVVTVILYDPKSSIWGGEVAAPVFKDVATFALQELRVAPSESKAKLYPTTWK
ncbi:peptidoglycan D,D-transpeptidase FtsI family protein [Demequina sp.]|uniref:peptidoglycan D,D-transpeptidase FtsI family protein n=1 Tax=Demequina sp. TaxID=2050685 RepID=UPI003D0EE804